ncbi:MAG: SBBP repeat-containing protein [Saprospiraceae bacterium]
MNKFRIGLLAALLPFSLFAQTLEWAGRAGGNNKDVGNGLEIDANGNVYTTGIYQGTVDFDPGPGQFNLISLNSTVDIFIQKLDPAGNFIWAKSIRGMNWDQAWDMVLDAQGNIYLTGYFQDSTDFDPGPGIYRLGATGNSDAFVCKLDSTGNLLWARNMGGAFTDTKGRGIAVDPAGSVYTTGLFEFEGDFDPSPAVADTFMLIGSFQDVFIQKLDANGDFQWARRFGELYFDQVYSLKIASDGQVLVFGHVTGTAKYGTIATTDSITVNGTDPFILRIDPANGNLVWAKHFGGPLLDQSHFMQVDADGNIYTCGSFLGTADLDPGPDSFLLSSGVTRDNFLQKLDPDGNFLWAIQYQTGASPSGLQIDANDNLILMGTLVGKADLDPGPAVHYFTASGDYDFFIQKLDADLEQVWVQVSRGPDTEGCSDIKIDTSGAIFLIGGFRDSIDADPGPGITILKAKGSMDDIFILKWQQGLDFNGRVFQDLNNNQVLDAGEPPLPNIVMAVPGKGQYTTSNSLGKFRFNAAVTGDTLVAVMPRNFWTATPAFYVPDSSQAPMDFAVFIQPGLLDVNLSAIALTPFQPGRKTDILIQLRNNGSALADSVLLSFSIDDLPAWITVEEAHPAPLAVFGDSLVWQIDSLDIDSVALIKLSLKTSPNAVPGTELAYLAEASLANDIFLQDNRFEVETQIVGSFDPNDKQVSPGLFSPLLLDSIALRYVIRFQNTGNFPAEQVLILDTLAESLDLSSLKVIGTSHPCTWRLINERVLEFLFANIALPDSISNESGSHGFAAFAIQPRSELVQGDSIHNRVAIYFDFNAPVLTNHAITAVDRDQDGDGFFSAQDCDDLAPLVYPNALDIPGNGIDENCDGLDAVVATGEASLPLPLFLWPNPAQDQLLVGFGTSETGFLDIWTATGQLLECKRIEGLASYTLSMGDYQRGVCILRFRSDSGRVMAGQIVLK